jgi:outer membrane protein TolC
MLSHRIVALVAASLAHAACAAEAPLTLAQAQRIAVARSTVLPAQEAAVTAARESAVAAGQWRDPVLRVGLDNFPVSGPDAGSFTRDSMTMARVGVMQEVTSQAKRQARASRYEREAEKALAEKSAAEATIARDVALAWIDRYFAEATVKVIGEQMAEADLEVEAADLAYRTGRGGQPDVFAARASRAALEEKASDARRRALTANTMLARWIGSNAQWPLAPPPDFVSVPVDRVTLESQLAHHPRIVALARQEETASAEAAIARIERDPDWSFEVAYQQRGPGYGNMMSFGVNVPLPWDRANRQDRDVAAKLALADQARALREDALRAHVAEVAAMLEEWTGNRERLALFAQSLAPLARERTAASLAAYRGGKGTLSDVLAARRYELDVRRDALALERETARLWAELNYLDTTHAKEWR